MYLKYSALKQFERPRIINNLSSNELSRGAASQSCPFWRDAGAVLQFPPKEFLGIPAPQQGPGSRKMSEHIPGNRWEKPLCTPFTWAAPQHFFTLQICETAAPYPQIQWSLQPWHKPPCVMGVLPPFLHIKHCNSFTLKDLVTNGFLWSSSLTTFKIL